jgi:DNA repair protein RadA/Sms
MNVAWHNSDPSDLGVEHGSMGTVVFGEIGLTGEVRGISQIEARVKEAARMGFTRCIIPKTTSRDKMPGEGMKIYRISSLRELMAHLF